MQSDKFYDKVELFHVELKLDLFSGKDLCVMSHVYKSSGQRVGGDSVSRVVNGDIARHLGLRAIWMRRLQR